MTIRIETLAETGSTNGDLLARIAAGERIPEAYWLIADRQFAGRGRQGRRWLDGPGNFMGSTAVSLSPHDPPPATLSFVAALAVYETVLPRMQQPRDLQLKWPNDVMLRGDKFCGLLLERERDQAVVGVGVNLAAAPNVIERTARSLSEEGPVPARDAFAGDLARQFDEELGRWRQFGTGPILARWSAAAHPEGTPLVIHDSAGERVAGAYAGLEPDGALRLRLVDGSLRVIHAGDVSVGS